MRILITGGAGFIGSNLAERLSSRHEVVSLDNYFTGSTKNHKPNVDYINGCTTDINQLVSFKPEVVFHFGEYSRVEQSFGDFDLVYKYNVEGTKAVLDFTKRIGNKLIYAGSSTKFGDIGANSSPYAWSKSNNTQLVINYGEWFNINYAITYFYNVYGKGEIEDGPYATLIAKFAKLVREGKPLTVTTPGTQQRNFTHIDDTIDALVMILDSARGDGYGIANPNSYTVLEVAKMFTDNIIMTDPKPGNRNHAENVSSKTASLGWSPTRNLVDYIESIKNGSKEN